APTILTFRPAKEDFCTFIQQTVEGDIFRKYSNGRVDISVVKNGTVKFEIKGQKIQAQETYGASLARNQKGDTLNFQEDIRQGDTIQIMFTMVISNINNHEVKLNTTRIVKHVPEGELPTKDDLDEANESEAKRLDDDDSEDDHNSGKEEEEVAPKRTSPKQQAAENYEDVEYD